MQAQVYQLRNGQLYPVDAGGSCDCMAQLEDPNSELSKAYDKLIEDVINEKIENGELAGSAIKVGIPKITLPAEGVKGVALSITFTEGASSTNPVREFLVSFNGGDVITVAATEGMATFSYTPTAAGTLTVVCKARDSKGHESKEAMATVEVIAGKIAKPVFTSPVEGAEVVTTGGITLVTDAFKMEKGTGRHTGTDWALADNAAGDSPIVTALGSSDLLSHTFNELSLDAGKTYYGLARHLGDGGLVSEWSSIGFVAKNGVVAPSGHVLWALDDAVCFQYDDGTGVKTLAVGLAASRASELKWQNDNTDISAMTNYAKSYFKISAGMTDAQLNAKDFNDTATAKSNTTNMKAAGSPAADYVRSKTIGGVACDVPNIQQLMRIFALNDEIDALDHTVTANPSLSLSKWGFSDNHVWASTEASATSAWYVRSDGECSSLYYTKSENVFGVIPILELS